MAQQRAPLPEFDEPGADAPVRRSTKSAAAFRTISEVAEELGLPAHVLRFWETKFPQLRPLKRGGGRRYYRPEDVALLRRIRECLYREGYTIKGVQKLLRERPERGGADRAGPKPAEMLFELEAELGEDALPEIAMPIVDGGAAEAAFAAPRSASREALRSALEEVRRDLIEMRDMLDGLRQGEP